MGGGGSGNYETGTGNNEMRTSGRNLSYFGNVASSFNFDYIFLARGGRQNYNQSSC